MSKANRSKSGKRGKPGARPQKLRLPSQISVYDIVKRFAVCGRCSFFVAGYKLLVGNEAWETAVNQTDGRWLRLIGSNDVAQLVGRSFGSRLDIDCFHYEGRCPECQRVFQYRAAGGNDLEEPLFQIEV
jgi:hypothetical protein